MGRGNGNHSGISDFSRCVFRRFSTTTPANGASTTASTVDPNAYFVDELVEVDGGEIPPRSMAPSVRKLSALSRTLSNRVRFLQTTKAFDSRGIGPNRIESGGRRETRVCGLRRRSADGRCDWLKLLAHLSLWLFVALLSGAFCASYAGTIGGRQRDHVPAV